MNPEVWGPHYWFFLFTIAMNYPQRPTTVTKKKYYEFIQNFPLFIPSEKIGNNFAKLLDKYPVTPYLDSRMEFMKWTHFMHNKINEHLDKQEVDFYDALELYYKHYEPKDMVEKKRAHLRRRNIDISILVIMSLLVMYCIKK
jgi:hypothetical protein